MMRCVPRVKLDSICRKVVDFEQPFVLVQGVAGWPALSSASRRWSLHNLANRTSLMERIVPVEFFGNYMNGDMQILHVEMADLISYFVKEEEKGCSSSSMNKDGDIGHLYLAQYDLKDLPELQEDCCGVPKALLEHVGRGLEQRSNVWLGKAGVMSPAHTDPFHNLLCQVKGSKRVILHPFDIGEKYLYPAKGTAQPNTSLVDGDLDDADPTRFPLVVNARQHAVEAVLQEGDALFIPKKHWHHCTSLELSFSVNYWWL